MDSEISLLTTGDAARILSVSADSIRLYHRQGKLHALRTEGGQRLFRHEDVAAFAKTKQQRPQPRSGTK